MARARDIFLIQDELSGHFVSSSRHENFSDITDAALFHSEANAAKAIKEIERSYSREYGRCQFSDGVFSEYWHNTKEYLTEHVTTYPSSYKPKDDYFVDDRGSKFIVKELKLRVVPCKVVPQLS